MGAIWRRSLGEDACHVAGRPALEGDRWWVYISTRDGVGKSRIGRLVVDTSRLANGGGARVLELHPEPVLSLGEMGTFDDSGVMPSWLVDDGGAQLLYYIGWNVIGTVPYRLSIGLAISEDGGQTFRRRFQGPIIDRSIQEPFFATAPCVIRENDKWRMYYASCTGWESILGRWEPRYHVKYAASAYGIHWELTGRSCIEAGPDEAIGRPCAFRHANGYAMLYSRRSIAGYRTKRENSYRLGYADSADGISWSPKESEVGIERSDEGWDAEMMEYCWVQQEGLGTYLLYNGNGFGATASGWLDSVASLEDFPPHVALLAFKRNERTAFFAYQPRPVLRKSPNRERLRTARATGASPLTLPALSRVR